jgi:hypothetical protein
LTNSSAATLTFHGGAELHHFDAAPLKTNRRVKAIFSSDFFLILNYYEIESEK